MEQSKVGPILISEVMNLNPDNPHAISRKDIFITEIAEIVCLLQNLKLHVFQIT